MTSDEYQEISQRSRVGAIGAYVQRSISDIFMKNRTMKNPET